MEHFTISNVVDQHPIRLYKLNDLNGEPLKGSFYRDELEPILDNTYYVEKILKRRGKDVFVKWLGWGSDFNSWIPKTNIVDK